MSSRHGHRAGDSLHRAGSEEVGATSLYEAGVDRSSALHAAHAAEAAAGNRTYRALTWLHKAAAAPPHQPSRVLVRYGADFRTQNPQGPFEFVGALLQYVHGDALLDFPEFGGE